MTRSSGVLSLFVVLAWVAPGCSGSEFSSADDNGAAGDAGESGKGGAGGRGGSSSGTAGSDVGGSNVGGSSNGGTGNGGGGRGGSSGTSSGGSPTGGDAGEGASGGTGPGGMGGSAGTAVGGAGAGNGGVAGRAGSSGTGGRGGTSGGGAGKGGSSGAGSGGKGGSGGAGSGGKSGSGGQGGSGGAVETSCPPTAPLVNAACSYSDDCTYGTHPLASCRDVYNCVQGHWQQTQAPNCGTPPSCDGASTPPVVGADCTPNGYECRLDQTVFCMCAADCASVCSLPPIWHCFGPPAGCPASLPNQGQPCSGTMTCTYGTCSSQTSVRATCQNGSWNWQSGICAQ